MPPYVTDHAVLRYLERVNGLPLEQLRREIGAKAARSVDAAQRIGGGNYLVKVDGVMFRCVGNRLVTVLTGDAACDRVD